MNKTIVLISILATLAFGASAEAIQSSKQDATIKQTKELCKDTKILNTQQRGCCSWHGGVAGCSNGIVKCNDGTLSPTCTCNSSINPLG